MIGMTKEEFRRQWEAVAEKIKTVEFIGGAIFATEYTSNDRVISIYLHDVYLGVVLLESVVRVN